MPEAPKPANENARLAAVHRLRMIGTPAEERFDRITRIAKRSFNCKYAMIDFVDKVDIWIKAAEGFDGMSGPRCYSYCQYTILSDAPCLVVDARTDPRTSDLPWRDEHVFYAGVALHFDGQRVGSFCIADPQPRELSENQIAMLHDLANLAEHEMLVGALSESQHALAVENEQLARAALVDPLTRVWNRGGIEEIATRELVAASIQKTTVGIIMLDIDHFKRVNDTLGHQAGDAVLRQVSSRLRQGVRPNDAVGRFGGEEFLVVLPDTKPEETRQVAERIRSVVAAETVLYGTTEIPVTVSCGCTAAVNGASFTGIPLKAADEALYRAKAEGRNTVRAKWITPSVMLRVPKE